MKTIIELRQEEAELRNLLIENRKQQTILTNLELVEKTGINVGYAIEFIDGRKPKSGIVSKIEDGNFYVSLLKSDGTPGKRETRLWSYCLSSVKILSK